jgi:spore germination protein GerM
VKRVLVPLAIVLLMLSACAVRPDRTVLRTEDKDVPFGLLDPSAPAVISVVGGRPVSVCLLDEAKLVTVQRQLADDVSLLDVARALGALTDAEAARGLQTKLSSPDEIRSVALQAGRARVDLAKTADQAPAADPLATIAQIVCTLTAQPGVGTVSFSVNDTPIEVPTADGSLTDRPVARDDYQSMLAQP